MPTLYKIVPAALWREAERAGRFDGSPVDRHDGFIHFSTAAQVIETAAKHFSGQDDLLLVRVEAANLGASLAWEPARDGALFPHLYGPLDLALVTRVEPLPLAEDGSHRFPALDP
ncbi:MAG TPA: DUF952 domain-containing protein [Xanthobacteraceae bacterium]|nr:DUF952 domain-containing protein [Xanthobacteraceae bacterium]